MYTNKKIEESENRMSHILNDLIKRYDDVNRKAAVLADAFEEQAQKLARLENNLIELKYSIIGRKIEVPVCPKVCNAHIDPMEGLDRKRKPYTPDELTTKRLEAIEGLMLEALEQMTEQARKAYEPNKREPIATDTSNEPLDLTKILRVGDEVVLHVRKPFEESMASHTAEVVEISQKGVKATIKNSGFKYPFTKNGDLQDFRVSSIYPQGMATKAKTTEEFEELWTNWAKKKGRI